MKGTILDFLKLAAEEPELAKGLVDLAAKYGFEFSDEVSDKDLEKVAGGTDPSVVALSELVQTVVKESYDAAQSALAEYQAKLQSFQEGKEAIHEHLDSLRDTKSAG